MKKAATELRECLKEKKQKQHEAAEILGVSHKWINDILCRGKMPSDKLKLRMKDEYNIDPANWYEEADK